MKEHVVHLLLGERLAACETLEAAIEGEEGSGRGDGDPAFQKEVEVADGSNSFHLYAVLLQILEDSLP